MRVSQIFVTYGAEGKERDFARIIDSYSTIRFVLAVSHAFVDSVECRQLSSRRMKNEYVDYKKGWFVLILIVFLVIRNNRNYLAEGRAKKNKICCFGKFYLHLCVKIPTVYLRIVATRVKIPTWASRFNLTEYTRGDWWELQMLRHRHVRYLFMYRVEPLISWGWAAMAVGDIRVPTYVMRGYMGIWVYGCTGVRVYGIWV